MNANQLLYLAMAKPEVGDALIKIASAMEKKAQQNPSAFDETVQSEPDTKTSATNDTGMQADTQPQERVDELTPEEIAAEEAAMAEDEQGEVVDDEIDPAVVAAQQFLAPVFEAAANGDTGAQAVLARAAAEIATSVAKSRAEAAPAVEEELPPEEQPPMTEEEAAQAQEFADRTSSTQAAADRIVPAQA
jgi:hypothetical protein